MPDLALSEVGIPFLVSIDELEEVTTVCVLHHHTEAHVLEEGLLVTNNIWVLDRGQDAYFV